MPDLVLIPRGLCRAEAAGYLGIGVTLFDQLVSSGELPAAKRIRSRVLWDRIELDAAFDAISSGGGANPWDVEDEAS